MSERVLPHMKNAVITGCNRGIGLEILKVFVKNDINVWACIRSCSNETDALFQSLASEYGVWIKTVPFDLSDKKSLKEAAKKILGDKQQIDILVNNAGITYSGMFQMTTVEDLERVMTLNFINPMYFTQLISRQMVRQKKGSIVNIASTRGISPIEGSFAYGSSKAAIIYATSQLSKELGHFHIRVNAVAPGRTNTEMGTENLSTEDIEKVVSLCTLKRLGEPEEIASMVYYLADSNEFITGQTIRVDGGV